MKGCINSTIEIDSNETNDNNELPSPTINDDEIIIVRRQTQIVRAIEPRTGEERWNFSVAQHELVELNQKPADCHSTNTHSSLHDILTNLEIKVIVPDGIICAVQKSAPNVILWKHKFDHPIVNAWKRDEENQLKAIDLFQSVHGMWQYQGKSWTQQSIADDDTDDLSDVMPSIYIGMFKRQLYIQESDQLRIMQTKFNDHMLNGKKSFARIPWKPIDASGLELIDNENDKSLAKTNDDSDNRNDLNTVALSILYGSEYVNGNGFYLYADKKTICDKNHNFNENSDEHKQESNLSTSDSDFDNTIHERPTINVISLWYWWREITLIVMSALVFNVFLTFRAPSVSPSATIPVSVFDIFYFFPIFSEIYSNEYLIKTGSCIC